VKQHFDVFRRCGRNTRRPPQRWKLPRRLLFRQLDTPFHVANRVEIFVELRTVTRTELANETRCALRNHVENAASLSDSRELFRRVRTVTVSEEALKHSARLILHWQRGRGSAPAQRVLISARAVARAENLRRLHAQLERRQLRVLL